MNEFRYDPTAQVVPVGTTIVTVLSGGQCFGSGGYSARTRWYGATPTEIRRWEEANQFTSKTCVELEIPANCLVVTHESDCIGWDGRDWSRAWICAEPDALKAAVRTWEQSETLRKEMEAEIQCRERKDFARSQARLLQAEHDLSADEAWQVIRAGGPGAAIEAVVWAKEAQKVRGTEPLLAIIGEGVDSEEAVWQAFGVYRERERSWKWAKANYGQDAINTIRYGRGGRTGFGLGRILSAMTALGYEAPPAHSRGRLDAVLDAALAYLRIKG